MPGRSQEQVYLAGPIETYPALTPGEVYLTDAWEVPEATMRRPGWYFGRTSIAVLTVMYHPGTGTYRSQA